MLRVLQPRPARAVGAVAAPRRRSRSTPRCVAQAAVGKTVYVQTVDAAARSAALAAGFKLLQLGGTVPREQGTELVLDGALLTDAAGKRLGRSVTLRTSSDQAAATALAGLEEVVLVRVADGCWQVIPAENLVAAFATTRTRLLFACSSAEDAGVLLGALETGVDGVVLATDDAAEAAKLQALLVRSHSAARRPLLPATVTRVEQLAGLGDRACVDTASVLAEGEGLLLSSFASGFFLVIAETASESSTGYIAARPFRVNAGAVCNYVLLGDKTAYLSELVCGSSVVLTDAAGRTRTETVGRVKLERRPLILLEAERGGQRYSVLLQNAETVRVATPSGHLAVTALQPGDEVLVATCAAARHGGVAIEEFCLEK